jgi:hypothetical protein
MNFKLKKNIKFVFSLFNASNGRQRELAGCARALTHGRRRQGA